MKKNTDDKDVLKNKKKMNQDDLNKVAKNYRAMNLLYCGLHPDEFEIISLCTSAKKLWEKLVVAYEGTSQAQETKMSIWLQQYELFAMQPNKGVNDIFIKFTIIVNNINFLGKIEKK